MAYVKAGLSDPRRWDREVRRAGIAVVAGKFVFEVLRRDSAAELVVLAARQLPDYNLCLSEAALTRDASGAWRLRWLVPSRPGDK